MKRVMNIRFFVVIWASLLAGCSGDSELSNTDAVSNTEATSATETVSDTNISNETKTIPVGQALAEIQALLPAISASLSLVQPSTSTPSANILSVTNRTIGAWNGGPSFPSTPSDMIAAPDTYDADGDGVYTFPANGSFIEDFYEKGDRGRLELTAVTDAWGDYRANLYIYPSLSTSVKYVLEQYRVPANDWTCLVSRTDSSCDAIGFENYKTVYFDGATKDTTVTWSRYVDSLAYDRNDFSMSDDFSNPIFDFPSDVSSVEPKKIAPSDSSTTQEYSSSSTFSVSHPNYNCNSQRRFYCLEEAGTEYYGNLFNGDNLETYSSNYVNRTISYQEKNYEVIVNTVTHSHSDAEGDKTIRSKGVQSYDWSLYNSFTTTTEAIDIDVTPGAATTYHSEKNVTTETTVGLFERISTYTSSSSLSLTETGYSTHAYTGTYNIQYDYDSRTFNSSYTVTLDYLNGLQITRSKSALRSSASTEDEIEVSFEFGNTDHTATETSSQQIKLSIGAESYDCVYEGETIYCEDQRMLIGAGFVVFEENEEDE